MLETETLVIVAATFLLAGAVKGVIGLGLPSVSLGILTAAIDLPTAMALLLVPSFVTNFWQGAVGGKFRQIVQRTWPFLLFAVVTIPIGALGLSRLDLKFLSGLLGLLLAIYGALSLAGLRLSISPMRESWAGPLFGAVNGALTGMTGSFVVPGVMYLQALGLPRDALVQAMGILFTLSTVVLGVCLGNSNLLTLEQGWVSLGAVIPTVLGMVLGQELRDVLSERVFRRVFFSALLLLGAYIVFNALA
jgi:uncharacterized membrane protein YfcA